MFKAVVYSALFRFVERDHGGCEEDNCSLRQAIDDGNDDLAVEIWASSGAACNEFNRIFTRFLEKNGHSA